MRGSIKCLSRWLPIEGTVSLCTLKIESPPPKDKQKLLENARFCSLSLSEYLRRLGLGKEVKAAITERDYRLFRMLNGLKAELPQLQKEEILSRLEAILNELK